MSRFVALMLVLVSAVALAGVKSGDQLLPDGIAVVSVSDVERDGSDVLVTLRVGDARSNTEKTLRMRHHAAKALSRLASEMPTKEDAGKDLGYDPEAYIREQEPNANEIRQWQIRNGVNVGSGFVNRTVRQIRCEPATE